MKYPTNFLRGLLFASISVFTVGCLADVPATNPFDPDTPEAQQAAAGVVGQLALPAGYPDSLYATFTVELRADSNPVEAAYTAQVSAQGAFVFEEVISARYRIFVLAEGLSTPEITLEAQRGVRHDLRTIQLEGLEDVAPTRITGTVRLAGAAEGGHGGITCELVGTARVAQTNSDGEFQIDVFAGEVNLRFVREDYSPQPSGPHVVELGETLNLGEPIVLAINPGTIKGTVELEQAGGADAPDMVFIEVAETDAAATATAADDWEFELNNVPPGVRTVRITAPGYKRAEVSGVVLSGGGAVELGGVPVERARGRVEGAFTLAGSQTSDGVAVILSGLEDSSVYTTLTSATGAYRFDGIPTGRYQIDACKTGYLSPNRNGEVTVQADSIEALGDVVVTRPNITIDANGGDSFTSERRYRLNFDVPTGRVSEVKVTGDAIMVGEDDRPFPEQGEYYPYQTDESGSFVSLILSEGDGVKSVQLAFRGGDCFSSESYPVLITLDSTGPDIIDAALTEGVFTSSLDVTLNLVMADAHEVRITGRNDAIATIAGQAAGVGEWVPASDIIVLGLNPGDVRRVIEVQARDRAGNLSEATMLAILVDTLPPLTTLSIAGGASHTRSSLVQLDISATDGRAGSGVTEMALADDAADCATARYQPYVPRLAWSLPDGDGSKSVALCVRDAAGNVASSRDTLFLDTVAPSGSLLLPEGGISNAAQVNIIIEREDDDAFEGFLFEGFRDCSDAAYVEFRNLVEAVRANPNQRLARLTFANIEGEASQTLTLCLRDEAGNTRTVVERVFVDRTAPILGSLVFDGPIGALENFANNRSVTVQPEGAFGGTAMVYDYFERHQNCPTVNVLARRAEFVGDLTIDFVSDGPKTICLAVGDDAGNFSGVRRVAITVDTVSPSLPSLSPQRATAVNRACVNLTPDGDLDDNFWKFQWRQLGGEWVDSLTAAGVAIAIDLYQDSDNFIEVRAVDRAGNTGEIAQAFIEETSSNFIPTDLQIKQICNGGQYAILKDMSVTHTVYNDEEAGAPAAALYAVPAVAILDLETYNITYLSRGFTLGAINGNRCDMEEVYASALDAVCSTKAGEPALLVVSPTESALCTYPVPDNPQVGIKLTIMPNPIENPLELPVTMADQLRVDGVTAALTHIDVIDWEDYDNDFEFRALGVIAKVISPSGNLVARPMGHDRFEYSLRRLIGSHNPGATTGTVSVTEARGSYERWALPSRGGDQYRMRGLSVYNWYGDTYLKWEIPLWKIYYHDARTGVETENDHLTDAANDVGVSPYNVLVGPAQVSAHIGTDEARGMYRYLSENGSAYVRRGNNSNTRSLGSGAPLVDGHRWAPFFEDPTGVRRANWADAVDGRTFYGGMVYGNENVGLQYAFAMDVEKGVFPYMLEGGAADERRHVLYHTSGMSNGIVVGYLNEDGCAE